MLQTYGHRTIPCFLHRLTGIGVTQWWRELFIFSTGWLELVLQTHDSHKTIPCFHHRLTGLGVTDTRWYRHTMVTGPFLVFSTGWLELVLQTHCGHRTIPCLPWRLTRVGVPDTWWSQDHSLFSPQADWSLCYRLTGIGVTQTWWSEDHSLFSPQVDWNLCYRDLMVTGPFLVFSTGWLEFTQLVLHLQTCVGHRTDRFLHRLTGIGVTHNGHRTIPCFFRRLTGIGVTDTQWSQDHSLFSPQVDWNWCYRHTMVTGPFLVFSTGWLELVLQTHDGHRTIPCFLHRLTGIGVTDTQLSQDHSLFSPQVDWKWCYRHKMVTGPFLVFSTGWLEFVLQVDWNWCYRDMMVRGPLLVFSTGWLELVLQRHDGHRTIPCFLHRLTGIPGVTLTNMCWSQDWSFSPQVHWTWCTLQTRDDHRMIPCFLHRLTGIGYYRHTVVTGPFLVYPAGWLELVLQIHVGHRTIPCFLHRLTGIGVTETWWSQDQSLLSPQADWNSLNWCCTYRHALVTGLIVFSTGSLELVYLTDTWLSQDHSLFSPQADWSWCYRYTLVTGPFLVFSTGWLCIHLCVLKPSGQEILFAPLVGFWPM